MHSEALTAACEIDRRIHLQKVIESKKDKRQSHSMWLMTIAVVKPNIWLPNYSEAVCLDYYFFFFKSCYAATKKNTVEKHSYKKQRLQYGNDQES